MRILLTGASGFVGAALLPRLLEQGHEVRALARDRERVRRALAYTGAAGLDDVEVSLGDTLSGNGVAACMHGIDVAYYLIHSMEPPADGAGPASRSSFAARERASADTFAQAARAAGVKRIVYLGGLVPSQGRPSTHLASRYAVERILLEAVPASVALRASVVIGARSRSFRFLVRLIERMPVLALPGWRHYRTQPIDERDVVELLAACAQSDAVRGQTLDIGGPDILSYGEMVQRIASLMLLSRPSVGLPLTATPLSARLAASLTRESPELIIPLMEGLTGDLLPAEDRVAELLDVELHSFDSAVEHALYEWERIEPLA
ncbi:MAG: NAD(P)H-binding protein, partial [Solirubrobacteraceae bacterium]